ncbi:SpoIID/LytB domain-containing protein [Paenibacillus antri]|uniref:SpoIID/LytB domain-containing protein n=1 Tax=Paenibacillus antri TaxID=2582848 RepID=A0A5R9GEJ9_9BACL|nr:SpoIID/LytB domain-containing protein [Paenibacillus antri]TLS53559.1 SpoIID/LytB domain-containing protein [Paenibacillus antri]
MKPKFWLAAVVAAALLAGPALPVAPAFADGGEAEVHVALYVKTNNYNALTGAVTLSAEGGLVLSDAAAGVDWLRTADASAVRATTDGYRVVVVETGDAAKAAAFAADVKKAAQPVAVFERTKGGKPLYAVEAGPYATKAAAEAGRTALAGNAAVATRLAGAAMTLRGPFYARASSHASEAEALAAAAPLWDAGVYAVPALTSVGGGAVRYELWIGGAADDAGLQQAISAAAAAKPGLSAMPVAPTVRYALLRSDRVGDANLAPATRHAAVGGDGAKLTATPAKDGGAVRVAERFARSYRGAIDVFAHNGALAVVNRVDLESYVAAVVGAELDASWPVEALKAQAVAARTYVLKQGWKYGVANVTDTTADQAYRGIEREFPVILAAAEATAGERLTLPNGALLDAFYSSNAGGRTADPVEVWGAPIPGLASIPSPDDAAERNKLMWYRVVLPDQRIGYIRSDLVKLSGATNAAGFPLGAVAEDAVNVRTAPFVNNDTNPSIASLAKGAGVTVIDRDIESTAYQWIRGPIDAGRLQLQMNASGVAPGVVAGLGTPSSIEVTGRGAASARVTEVVMNGKNIPVTRPEQYRTLFGLPSSRFEVEQTGAVTALGAGGKRTELSSTASQPLSATGANGVKKSLSAEAYLISNGDGSARVATRGAAFRFHGTGFGHGLGLSQWGAFGLAEIGYDYRKILLYYYKDASVTKE